MFFQVRVIRVLCEQYFHRKIFIYIDLRPYLSTKIIFPNNSGNFTHIFSSHISRHLYIAKHCIFGTKHPTLSWQIATNFSTLNAFLILACFDCFACLCITWSSFFVFFLWVGDGETDEEEVSGDPGGNLSQLRRRQCRALLTGN